MAKTIIQDIANAMFHLLLYPLTRPQQGFSGPAPVYMALVDLGGAGPGGGHEFLELVGDNWCGLCAAMLRNGGRARGFRVEGAG